MVSAKLVMTAATIIKKIIISRHHILINLRLDFSVVEDIPVSMILILRKRELYLLMMKRRELKKIGEWLKRVASVLYWV